MKTTYLGGLRTEGVHLKSGNVLITDAPTDNKGKGEAYSPTDLVCAALSSCMITTMGIVADRDQIDVDGITADITKVMAADPRRIGEIIIDLKLPKDKVARLDDKQRTILKRTAYHCPVAISLHPEVKQTISFNF